MAEPYNYTSGFAGLQSPSDAFITGIKNGAGIQQIQAERAAYNLKQQQAAQMQADLAALSRNPTTSGIAAMSIKYPQLSEGFKRSYDMLEPAKKQAKLESATQIYAAMENGRGDLAKDILKRQADAARNSGDEQEARAAEAHMQLIDTNPNLFKMSAGKLLAAAVGPDKFAETFAKIGDEQRSGELQGDLVRKGAADADAAVAGADSAKSKAVSDAVDAKYADQTALLKLEGIRTDNQYKRDQTKIAYLNAQIARESNALQRQKLQLDLDKAVTERDEKVRGKVADAESAASNMDNMLNTIERIKQNPRLNAVLGSIEGRTPAITDDGSDAIALIETLGSQAFLSQIPNIKGMGALSNAEGEKLQAAFQNLSRVQSEKQFRATLDEATRLLNKGRATVSKRYGVPLGNPDTPAAGNGQAKGGAGARPPLSSFGG